MKYNGNNLEEVLNAHKRWMDTPKGWSKEDRADLSGVDLKEVDLTGAYLGGAYLSGADLSSACLRGADLRGAYLSGAYLDRADFSGADLSGADLSRAHISEACLRGVDLTNADLRKADLSEADLDEACLSRADLRGAKNVPFIPLACPDTGAFVAWKKCISKNGAAIVKLLIPEDAKRSSGTGRKCRADRAVVLDIQTISGDTLEGAIVWSAHDNSFFYCVGETVTPKEPFDDDRFNECSSGIHFFINRKEAVWY